MADMQCGNQVKLKGRNPEGMVLAIANHWVQVRWDGVQGPKFVHELELDVIADKAVEHG